MISVLCSLLINHPAIAAQTWPDRILPMHGELITELVIPENKMKLGAVKIEMLLDLQNFTKSNGRLLSQLDGQLADVFAYQGRVHSIVVDGQPEDQVSKITLYGDGVRLEGKLLRHDKVIYMQIPSVDGKKQVQVRTQNMLPETLDAFLRQPSVIVHGFLHDGGKVLQVSRMEDAVASDDDGITVYVRGALDKAPEGNRKNLFFFPGPNEEKYYLKPNKSVLKEDMIGSPVTVVGKNLQGGIEIKYLSLRETINADVSCADRLLGELLVRRGRN